MTFWYEPHFCFEWPRTLSSKLAGETPSIPGVSWSDYQVGSAHNGGAQRGQILRPVLTDSQVCSADELRGRGGECQRSCRPFHAADFEL